MLYLGLLFRVVLSNTFSLLVNFYTCGLLDSFEHFMRATLFLFTTTFGVCTQKQIVTLSELKKSYCAINFTVFTIVKLLLSIQPLFPESQILCVENKHRSLTE